MRNPLSCDEYPKNDGLEYEVIAHRDFINLMGSKKPDLVAKGDILCKWTGNVIIEWKKSDWLNPAVFRGL